jgi:hypothetical protein
MDTPQEPLHGGLERVAHARGGKAMSGTRTCAQQGHPGDGEQRPLVPRSRCSPRLMPGVSQLEENRRATASSIGRITISGK